MEDRKARSESVRESDSVLVIVSIWEALRTKLEETKEGRKVLRQEEGRAEKFTSCPSSLVLYDRRSTVSASVPHDYAISTQKLFLARLCNCRRHRPMRYHQHSFQEYKIMQSMGLHVSKVEAKMTSVMLQNDKTQITSRNPQAHHIDPDISSSNVLHDTASYPWPSSALL